MSSKTKSQVKKHIEELISEVGWVTYPQLLRYLKRKGVEIEGNYNLEITEKNIFLWGKISKVVVDSIVELMVERTVEATPVPMDLYKVEGFSFSQPIILRIPEQRLETTAVYLTVLRFVTKTNDNG